MGSMKKLFRKISGRAVATEKKKNSLPANMTMGRGSYFGKGCLFVARDGGKITVGNYCSIASNVTIYNVNHNHHNVSTYPFSVFHSSDPDKVLRDRTVGNVTIGNDVWIGRNATILKDVTVGDGAVIGAGAIVSRPVPPYAVVAGIPAKVIRYRFSPEEIAALLQIKWWQWPEEKIMARLEDFYLPVDRFIEKFSFFSPLNP